jgi:ribosomal protein L16/L10AE
MHTCEDYVVEKLMCLEDDNETLQFKLKNTERLLQIAQDKLEKARLAISRYIKHNGSGQIYIDGIWSEYDKDDFIRITEALDIPMSEREVTQDERKRGDAR